MNRELQYENIFKNLGRIFLVIGAMWLTKAMLLLSITIPSIMLIVITMLVLLGLFGTLVWQGISIVKLILEL